MRHAEISVYNGLIAFDFVRRSIGDLDAMPGGLGNRTLDLLQRQGKVGISREITGHILKAIDDDIRSRLERTKNFLGARNDNIATDHQIGTAGSHADGVDIFGSIGDTDMAVDGTTLLREPGHGQGIALVTEGLGR